MAKELNRTPDFDDIVFEHRNKEYGAFVLRKKYSRNVIISLLIGIIIMTTATFIPYINARALKNRQKHVERQVEIKMENFDQPEEIVAPPPPPPPADVIRQAKYVPPVVVDSVKLEDATKLMTADQAQIEVKNTEPVEEVQEVKKEVLQEEQAEPEPFLEVQEMPEPRGGLPGLYKYIAENTRYPEEAKENNIQGKVFVRFCVTSKGNVEQISILKNVDPQLDAEAIRVVKTFPPFKPGKQYGRPVPVWFVVQFNFQLN
jgi:periplasmic protein TonB